METYKLKKLCLISIFAVFITGCAEQGLYQWGNYENFIYSRYAKQGVISDAQELTELENDLVSMASNQRNPPPGLHAHMGYLYSKNGNYEKALYHFECEKKIFPESSHFIDGLIKRMEK